MPFSLSAVWRWRLLALLLVLGAAALHLAWLIHDCTLDLAPDEAHYWDWSRRLDFSYYSKGPLVAWLIRAGSELVALGSGDAVLGVRLPALLCTVLFLASLYVLTVQTSQREDLACAVVAVALTMPVVGVMASIMTIDAPYLACWGWALVLGRRAVFHGAGWAWLLTGLVVGLGILAKYTMVLWPASLLLFLVATPAYRPLLRRPGVWVMLLTAGVCCLPIAIWNFQNDWVTFKHVGALASGNQRVATIHWLGPLTYLGAQFGLLLGFWFVLWTTAMIRHHPGREDDPALNYLWWLSAPVFMLFLAFSPKTAGGEVNWPVTAYVSGLVLVAVSLTRLAPARRRARFLLGGGLVGACAVGGLTSVVLHYPHGVYPLLGPLADALFPQQRLAVRRLDPTCRLRGWQQLADEVDQLRAGLTAAGIDPVVAGAVWNIPGELGFYCRGNPTVYSLGLAVGDRHSQYDLWRANPVADPEAFRGRTFILVGDFPDLGQAFTAVSDPCEVEYQVAGRPVNAWRVRIGHGYRGFPTPTAASRH